MRFKNETNQALKYYGFDDHGYKQWQVLDMGQEGNMPKDKGLGLGLTLIGEDKAFTPLTVKNMVVKTNDDMQLGEDGPIVPKMPTVHPRGKTTSENNISLKGKPIEKPKEEVKKDTKPQEVEDKPEETEKKEEAKQLPLKEIVEKAAEDIRDLVVPGHEAKKKDETAEVGAKTEVKEDLAKEVKKISGIGESTAKDIGALYSDKKEMVKSLKEDKHIPLRDDTVDLLKKKYLKE